MEEDKDDDFMCMRVGDGKTIATYKGVTVVATKREDKGVAIETTKRKEQAENRSNESIEHKSWWRRLLGR